MINISIVSSLDKHNGIGKNNTLLYKVPEDMAHFKSITSGGAVLMGRRTYESIGKNLPDRLNIILTSNKNYVTNNAIVIHTHEEVFDHLYMHNNLFVIGGAQLFSYWIPRANDMYLTHIHDVREADSFFPNITLDEWDVRTIKHHNLFDIKHYRRLV